MARGGAKPAAAAPSPSARVAEAPLADDALTASPPRALSSLPPPREGDPRSREAEDLVRAARTGDPRAFEALVKRYRHRIFALALHMTGSQSDADDITQDAFLRAYRNLDRFEGRSEFFTWLYRIALNRALNVRRDRTRRRTQDIDDPRVVVAVAVDARGNAQLAMELREAYGYLVQAFDQLSPVLRTTVALVTMQGLSHSEAAVVLDSTEGTISWRVHEARKQMRKGLEVMLKDPTPLRRADFARAKPAEPTASSMPSLEMALALLAPSV